MCFSFVFIFFPPFICHFGNAATRIIYIQKQNVVFYNTQKQNVVFYNSPG